MRREPRANVLLSGRAIVAVAVLVTAALAAPVAVRAHEVGAEGAGSTVKSQSPGSPGDRAPACSQGGLCGCYRRDRRGDRLSRYRRGLLSRYRSRHLPDASSR